MDTITKFSILVYFSGIRYMWMRAGMDGRSKGGRTSGGGGGSG